MPYGTVIQLFPWSTAGKFYSDDVLGMLNSALEEVGSSHKLIQKTMNGTLLLIFLPQS